MAQSNTFLHARIAVVGGSYAGLCSGLALRCIGADAQVYEASTKPDRVGGGIVVQPDFAEYLEAFGYARPETVATPSVGRRVLAQNGKIIQEVPDGTFFTAWDTVLRSLREHLEPERLHGGKRLISFHQDDHEVNLQFEDGSRATADLLVAADGIGSTIRRTLLPDIEPTYAGYVGYRGLVEEADLNQGQLELFRDHFVLYPYPHSHILCYFIPGENGDREPGKRRFNWVWYVSHTNEELDSILTDRDGIRHRSSLGPGKLAEHWVGHVKDKAARLLPPLVAQAVEQTPTPFVQAIFDLDVPKMVHGRTVLLGDAAFLVRPHTAAGASKAAADAIALAHTLRDHSRISEQALEDWQQERIAVARIIMTRGQMIATRGGLGG